MVLYENAQQLRVALLNMADDRRRVELDFLADLYSWQYMAFARKAFQNDTQLDQSVQYAWRELGDIFAQYGIDLNHEVRGKGKKLTELKRSR